MKKIYSKPDVMFESFTLSTNIAACANDTDLSSRDVCGYPWYPAGKILFSDSISQCNVYHDGDASNPICYHNPTESTNVFNS